MKQSKHTPELDGRLTMYHFPDTSVIVRWDDGSIAHWLCSFWRKEGDFTVVYSEHCGYHSLYLTEDDQVYGRQGAVQLSAELLEQMKTWVPNPFEGS